MYELLWILILYSFIGWAADCAFTAILKRKLLTRSALGGPVCLIYGFASIFSTVFLRGLTNKFFFLMLGCMVIFGGFEWLTGKVLEKIYRKKCWDYSSHRYNIDGHVSLISATVGGAVCAVGVKWLTPLVLPFILKLPLFAGVILQLTQLFLITIDIIFTYYYLSGIPQKYAKVEQIEGFLQKLTTKLSKIVIRVLPKRLTGLYETKPREKIDKPKPTVFAEGCSMYKIFILFFIAALLGDIVETVFCRITSGVWMSRSSLVWGPFSVVWGASIAGGTLLLYNYRNETDRFLFVLGMVLGGCFEYVCSVFTEKVFGQVFWDYSKMPFNLGGRINLLYCLFWGIASVLWFKILYPKLSKLIEKIPMKLGKCMTFILVIFMCANAAVSVLALTRYNERANNIPSKNVIDDWLDSHYDDATMKKIYPNSKNVSQKAEDVGDLLSENYNFEDIENS